MRIDIITCLPKLLASPFSDSILKRAQENKLVEIHLHDLRQYATNKHKKIDDYAYGGGAGMVLQIEPIALAIEALQAERNYDEIIFMSPDAEQFSQQMANEMALKENLLILCGHYKGVDERVRTHYITKEVSIGDFVISGGELAAAVFTDAVVRLLPGVLNDETSALTDSFQDGLLSPPVYTRPAEYKGHKVPEILLSGHEKKIEQWRFEQAIARTKARRPDLLKKE